MVALDRVLVVGATGRVGRMLARGWSGMGLRPVLQHRGAGVAVDLPQVAWRMGEALPRGRFDAMILLAGVVPGRGDVAENAAIAAGCLAAAEAAEIGQVLLASSSAVYGAGGGAAFAEGDVCVPVNDYGRAKLAAEAVAGPFRARGMAVCALRIGNVAGADALLLNVAAGGKVWIDRFADGGGPVRSYIGPVTMARVLAALVGRDLPEVLNLAAPLPVAMADLAAAAGADWGWRAAPATAHQRITLNLAPLARLVDFSEAQSRAETMLAEWRACGEDQ